jgi:hypothetical protein
MLDICILIPISGVACLKIKMVSVFQNTCIQLYLDWEVQWKINKKKKQKTKKNKKTNKWLAIYMQQQNYTNLQFLFVG